MLTKEKTVMDKLALLRQEMRLLGLDALIIQRTDEYQGEFIAPYAERLKWLLGFSGSAGMALITHDAAHLFIDGRYVLQAPKECDGTIVTFHDLSLKNLQDVIVALPPTENKMIGFDAWLMNERTYQTLNNFAKNHAVIFQSLYENPIDKIWKGQPPRPSAKIVIHAKEYCGEDSMDKRKKIATEMRERGADATIITASDSIAWLLNIRGGDVDYTPIAHSFLILKSDASILWFVDDKKLDNGVVAHVKNMRQYPMESFEKIIMDEGLKSLYLDDASLSTMIFSMARKGQMKIIKGRCLCVLPKACKNICEINGTREAHIRDGAAVVKFLHWLDEKADISKLSELSASEKLLSFRGECDLFKQPSFETISATGENAALCHYRVDKNNDTAIRPGDIYLFDSGGQYQDGTTDITRTIYIKNKNIPADPMVKDCFTRVLKGHIAIASAIFPAGVTGARLDPLARQFLWQQGLDYAHGTGHGIGHYLNVHEGPQNISRLENNVPLKAGMVISNEPGYYSEGHFGIRIENVIVVVPSPAKKPFGVISTPSAPLLAFETISLAPIDTALIDKNILTMDELSWLNNYHQKVYDSLSSYFTENDDEVKKWLYGATRPL